MSHGNGRKESTLGVNVFKVCLFDFPYQSLKIGEFSIESFRPTDYIASSRRFTLRDLVAGGLDGYVARRALIRAEGVDRMYRDRDSAYMRMVKDFVDKFHDCDLVVMSTFNFIHPEIIYRDLKKPIKIIGFVDDPHSSYIRGIPYLWAFDGAFYISPSYTEDAYFNEALEKWGCDKYFWWPLTQEFSFQDVTESFFRSRQVDIAYVGNPTLSKVDRLIFLDKHFGRRMRVHGRWRARGYYGLLRGLLGKPVYWRRVTSLTPDAKASLYLNTKIGFNMHVSDRPTETGNMRMYELPAHGVMQICDKAALNGHEQIFVPGVEAIFYDDMADAVDKIEYYLAHDKERIEIAYAGYERVRKDYDWRKNLLRFLEWAIALRK